MDVWPMDLLDLVIALKRGGESVSLTGAQKCRPLRAMSKLSMRPSTLSTTHTQLSLRENPGQPEKCQFRQNKTFISLCLFITHFCEFTPIMFYVFLRLKEVRKNWTSIFWKVCALAKCWLIFSFKIFTFYSWFFRVRSISFKIWVFWMADGIVEPSRNS